MIGGVTRCMLPHLSGVPHLHVNRPLRTVWWRMFYTKVTNFPERVAGIRGGERREKVEGTRSLRTLGNA